MTPVSRRIILISGGTAGAGLVLGFAGLALRDPKADAGTASASALNAWVSVAADGAVTVRVNSVDMGQGAQTGLAQIVADEMDADWSKIRVEMAPVIDSYLVKDGAYYTGGSSSIRPQFDMFAQAGATARAMLIAAAAKRWNVADSSCSAKNGFVEHGGKKLSFGELAQDAASRKVPQSVALKPRQARTLIGRPVPRLDIPQKVNGAAVYGTDVKVDGMLTGTLVQCPFFEGKLESVDENPALAVKGVKHVVKFDNGFAVVATNFWAAKKGADALAPRWTKPANAVASDDAMFAAMRKEIGAADSRIFGRRGADAQAARKRVEDAMSKAVRVFSQDYQVPFLSHAPMEPMNATARMTQDGCEIWAPMQNQSSMRIDIAKALNLPNEKVVLHTTSIGGGFGRRLETDYGVFAARTAKEIGAPVKLIWTREEDMSHDFYRPASVCRMRGALDKDNLIRAVDYAGATANDTAVGGMIGNYAFETVVRQKTVTMPMVIGAWRSVDPSITIFFLESFVDEVAIEAKADPLDYRRKLLAGDARALRVLDTAAQMAKWGHAPSGRHQGVAFFNSSYWGTAVAEIVELSVDATNRITLHKVFCAIDPGTAINPDQVKAQAEGGIVLGLSAALGEAITLKDGETEQKNFDSYSILKLAGAPAIEVQVLETPAAPIGGCGEPPVPPVAPALANALFAATAKRVRRLPLSASGFSV